MFGHFGLDEGSQSSMLLATSSRMLLQGAAPGTSGRP